MADIFVSYKRHDQAFVARLVALLETRQWSVWWDSRLESGEQWDAEIERQLHAARCVVVVWSPASVESYWVRSEAHYGRERGILVPVLIDAAHPPITFALIHATDLTGWSGAADDERLAGVLDRVARTIEGKATPVFDDAEKDTEPKRPVKSLIGGRLRWQMAVVGLLLAAGAAFGVRLLNGSLAPEPAIPAQVMAIRNASPVHTAMDWVPAGWTATAPNVKVYTDGFLIDRHEVTAGDFQAFVKATNYDYEPGDDTSCNYGRNGRERHPMNCLTWQDARAFADWAQKSLPREAEWLRAAVGRPPAPSPPAALGRQGTDVVGRYPSDASGFGPRDMLGNVSEWVADWYSPGGLHDGASNPHGPPSGQERTLLGAWYAVPKDHASIHLRRRDLPSAGRYRPDYGFRLLIRKTPR